MYELDRQDRICRISGPWDDFAEANGTKAGAETVSPFVQSVIGRPLHAFIRDDPTRMFLLAVLTSVRKLQRSRTVAYRCDAPDLKRFMQMDVEPLPEGGLRLTHRLLRTELLVPPFTFRPAVAADPVTGRRCSLCNRVEVHGAWVEPDQAAARSLPQPHAVRYGLCPVCLMQGDG
jgi:hypothetical protein